MERSEVATNIYLSAGQRELWGNQCTWSKVVHHNVFKRCDSGSSWFLQSYKSKFNVN